MKLSNTTGELFKAMSKCQAETGPLIKNSTGTINNSGATYSYADLAACLTAIKKPMADNGLSVVQSLTEIEGAKALTTMVTHSSGEWMSDTMRLAEAKLSGGAGNNPVQVMGSSISYQRRYAVAAMFALASEEDRDGEGLEAIDSEQNAQLNELEAPINPSQFKELRELMQGAGVTGVQFVEWAKSKGRDVGTLAQLPESLYEPLKTKLIKTLESSNA